MFNKSFLRRIYTRILFFVLFIGVFFGCMSSYETRLVSNEQLMTIGSQGINQGQFQEPRQLVITPFNTLLVSDFRNYRIQEFSLDGKLLNSWGRKGDQPGEFSDPTAAVMDSKRNLFVADTWNHRIQRFDAITNEWNASWAKEGYYAPRGIAIDQDDRLYIANTSNHMIFVFDKEGNCIAKWGHGEPGVKTFNNPIGIAVGPDNNIYIADTGNHRIKVVDRSGSTVRLIEVKDWKDSAFLEGYIAVDSEGLIYVTSPNNHKIIVFTPTGELFSRFGLFGFFKGKMNSPTGIAVTENKQIVISDTKNNRLVVYAPAPPLLITDKPFVLNNTIEIVISILLLILVLLTIICQSLFKFRSQPQKPIAKSAKWIASRSVNNTLLVVGYVLLLAGMVGFRLAAYTTLSALFMALALIAFVIAYQRSDSQLFPQSVPTKNRKRFHIMLMILIFCFALGIRFHKLDSIPSGINNDAAWNGIYAFRILEGEPYTPFTTEAWGKETFYFYLLALSFKLLDVSLYSLYLPCIIAGFLTVVFLYFLCKDLWSKDIALGATFVYAILAWNLTFSRTGYRSILSPLFFILTSWLFYRAVDSDSISNRLLYYAGAGLAIGIGLHTYFAFRGIPIMMIFVGIHTWITTPRFMRKNWLGLLVMQVFAWLAFLPLLLFAINNFEAFLARSGHLYIGNRIKYDASLSPLWENIIGNLQIFHYQANVGNFFEPTIPIISFPVAFFLVLGFAYACRHIKSREGFWIVMASFFGLLPGLLSMPDAGRDILVTVPLAICSSLGLYEFCRFISSYGTKFWSNSFASACFFIGLISIGILEYNLYFRVQAQSDYAQFGYARPHTLLGYEAQRLSKYYHIYVSNNHFLDTPKFLCYHISGDVFAISNGIELENVTHKEIVKNLEAIRLAEHSSDKGIAFLLDHFDCNLFVMRQINLLFPGITTREVFDEAKPNSTNPAFYVMSLPSGQDTVKGRL